MSRQSLYRKLSAMNPVLFSELIQALGLPGSSNIDAIVDAYLKLSSR
jgi:hypothetical protein